MLVTCRRALESVEQAGRAKHDPGVAGVPIVERLVYLLDPSVVDLDPCDIVDIEDRILVAIHGEAHVSRLRRIVGQRPRDPRIEKMVDHHQEEGRLAGTTLDG